MNSNFHETHEAFNRSKKMDRPERWKWSSGPAKGCSKVKFSLVNSCIDSSALYPLLETQAPLEGRPQKRLLYRVTVASPVPQGVCSTALTPPLLLYPCRNMISQNMILPWEFMRQKWGSDQKKLNADVPAPLCTLQIEKQQGTIKEKDQNKCLKLCHSSLHP